MKMFPVVEEIDAHGKDRFSRVSIGPLVGRLDACLSERLADYLQRANALLATGNVHDPLNEERGPVVPFGLCTDGEWVWPTYWVYFVREYRAQLPVDFIAHAQARGWVPVALTDEDLARVEEWFCTEFLDGRDGAGAPVGEE